MCDNWKKENLINPLTKRKIKKDGPLFKQFETFCKENDKNCKKIQKQKNINPLTGKKLTDKSKILDFFKKLCSNNIKESKKSAKIFENNDSCDNWTSDPLQCMNYKKIKLREHQKNVCNFIKNNPRKKGLVLFHSVGSGKTLTAITIIRCALEEDPTKKVFVVTPTSLVENFNKEMDKVGVKFKDNVKIFTHGRFINKIDKDGPSFCRDSIIIVDEAHNFKTLIKKGKENSDDAKSGKRVKSLMKATSIAFQVFLLTATPIQNNIQEFANLYAMISRNETNLSEVYKMFDPKRFEKSTLKKILKNKISYYKNSNNDDYPEVKYNEIVFLMTPEYYKLYMDIENENKESFELFGDKNLSVFYNGVRRAANHIDNSITSPKVEWILNFIKKNMELKNPKKILIYSNWIKSGLEIIQNKLNDDNIDWVEVNGKMSIKQRKKAVDRYNDIDGKVKLKVFILFISSAGAEGLDLKCTNSVIIMEPHWNDEKIKQVVGRAARYRSHADKNCEPKKVDVYNLILKKPNNKDILPSVDEYLRDLSKEKSDVINNFYDILIDSSV